MATYSRSLCSIEGRTTVTWQSLAARKSVKDFDLGGSASDRPRPQKRRMKWCTRTRTSWPTSSQQAWCLPLPKPQVKTSFTAMKLWMTKARPKCECIQFVNRIEKESSGISIIAKTSFGGSTSKINGSTSSAACMYWWRPFACGRRSVLLRSGRGKKKRTKHEFAYRTMRATPAHTLLKMEAGFEHVPLLMSGLRRQQCLLIGRARRCRPTGSQWLALVWGGFGRARRSGDQRQVPRAATLPQPHERRQGAKSRAPLETQAAPRRAARTSRTWERKKAPVRGAFLM